MKRGIFINLAMIFFLLFLILLPVLIVALMTTLGNAQGCDMNPMGEREGVCSSYYGLAYASALFGTVTSPIMAGVLALYLLGVGGFFLTSLVINRRRGQPVSSFAAGMMLSSIGMILIAVVGVGAAAGVNWYQVRFISACKGLPAALQKGNANNGPLALLARQSTAAEVPNAPEENILSTLSIDGKALAELRPLKSFSGLAWSPDGGRLAYTARAWETDQWGFYVVDDQLQSRRGPFLLDEREIQTPAWAPDGSSLLVSRWVEVSGNPDVEIYRVNPDGRDLQRISGSEKFDGKARYSPDGKQIVFVSNRDGQDDIYVMNNDGSNVRRLTRGAWVDTDPDWSPDGQWIVFSSNRNSSSTKQNYDLFIMAADGTNQCQLTHGADSEQRPVWSPDGNWIAYISLVERKVFLVSPDGSQTKAVPLPGGLTSVNYLDWAPGR